MTAYESFSFTRFYVNSKIEFFFILGVNDSDNFDEYWDGRDREVLGYAVIYKEKKQQYNFIYLFQVDHDRVIKYTKMFIQQMSPISTNLSDLEKFQIKETDIKVKSVPKPYKDFIRSIVKNDIPISAFDD